MLLSRTRGWDAVRTESSFLLVLPQEMRSSKSVGGLRSLGVDVVVDGRGGWLWTKIEESCTRGPKGAIDVIVMGEILSLEVEG